MGTRTSGDDRRIARNTLFLYFRQMLATGAGLYTVRVVLSALGEEDYGIYSVVGGFVAMFGVVSGSLSIAAGRFVTYEMGLPDASPARLRLIFSSSLVIQAAMGVAVCVLACTFGAWFVGTKMVRPAAYRPPDGCWRSPPCRSCRACWPCRTMHSSSRTSG